MAREALDVAPGDFDLAIGAAKGGALVATVTDADGNREWLFHRWTK
jgi:hypothetical protein